MLLQRFKRYAWASKGMSNVIRLRGSGIEFRKHCPWIGDILAHIGKGVRFKLGNE